MATSSLVTEVKERQHEDHVLVQYRDIAPQKEKTPFEITGAMKMTTYSVDDYARLYIKDIIRLHDVSKSIISDRSAQFTANFLRSFQKGLGTQMAPYKALYRRKCRSPIGWFEVGETKLVGLKLVQRVVVKIKLIRERLLETHSRQKSYADNRRQDFEFQVDDWVFLMVSPMKGVMRFGKKGKLIPRYIGPYKIIHRVCQVAYELDLPSNMESVHPVFHVSMLRKGIEDPSRVIPINDVQVTEQLSYEKAPIAILDRQVGSGIITEETLPNIL
ncbi:uncharacterized protein [Nicotiana tomentosiformis]|uniref:uncharacterized protein n=1 Tax=Nicotiana tomentosiformis TaxID=4098 RepID=UPI00388CE47B